MEDFEGKSVICEVKISIKWYPTSPPRGRLCMSSCTKNVLELLSIVFYHLYCNVPHLLER
jgi:hypothetical protein